MESHLSARNANVAVVLPEGRLDAQAAPHLEHALATLEAQGFKQIVLNFCHTSYISSSSLRIMIVHARKLRLSSGGLKLCCLPDKVSKVLCMTGLDTVFETFPSEELATQAFPEPSHNKTRSGDALPPQGQRASPARPKQL